MQDVEGKVAFITGGDIGRGMAKARPLLASLLLPLALMLSPAGAALAQDAHAHMDMGKDAPAAASAA